MKFVTVFLSAVLLAACFFPAALAADAVNEKQPVFLLCPKHERYGSWSLYVTVDKGDHSKVLSLGLEELVGKNSKDDGSYAKVLEAQMNPETTREPVATLDAASFGSGSLKVEKNNALTVTCTPTGSDYTLMIDMRISADGHFIIGGAEASKRNVILKYDSIDKKWSAYATTMANEKGDNVIGATPLYISGLLFPVTATGIYQIGASFKNGRGVVVYDGTSH